LTRQLESFNERLDLEVCSEAVLRLVCSPLLRYHGKWRCDSRFGGYEQKMKQTDLFGFDCIGRSIEGILPILVNDDVDDDDDDPSQLEATGGGLDFARIVDVIKQSDYSSFFKAQYNTITDMSRCWDSNCAR
jgi:hypothetical protein